MKDLLIIYQQTSCEGGEIVKLLHAFITKETGSLAIQQYDKDAIEINRVEALELAAYIFKYYDKIDNVDDF